MSEKQELEFGKTPWDKMSKEELLLSAKKMYSALVSCHSILTQERWGKESLPYWTLEGPAGRSVSKAEQVLKPLHSQWSSGDIYHKYFRYAEDSLFEGLNHLTNGWAFCPVCKICTEIVGKDNFLPGTPCHQFIPMTDFKERCKGVMEKFTLDSFEKVK